MEGGVDWGLDRYCYWLKTMMASTEDEMVATTCKSLMGRLHMGGLVEAFFVKW